jgi:hypothetical protein
MVATVAGVLEYAGAIRLPGGGVLGKAHTQQEQQTQHEESHRAFLVSQAAGLISRQTDTIPIAKKFLIFSRGLSPNNMHERKDWAKASAV